MSTDNCALKTYCALLDSFFSSYWYSLGIPQALIPVFYQLRSSIMKAKDASFGEICIVMGCAFVVMMIAGLTNPLWWVSDHRVLYRK